MIDKTNRDVRLGDMFDVEHAVAGRREPHLAGDSGHGEESSVPPRPAHAEVARAQAVSRRQGAFTPINIVLALLALVFFLVVVFLVVQVRDLTQALAILEEKSRASVATLESQVANTNTTLKSADGDTQQSLNVVSSRLGRLDAAVVRLNRQLEQNAQTVALTGTELKAVSTELKASISAGAQANTQLEARIDGRHKAVSDGLDQLVVRQKQLADNVVRLERKSDAVQLRTEVNLLGASIREQQDEHDRRLKATEQAIASGDAFRRQVNATIDRLNQQVGELYNRR